MVFSRITKTKKTGEQVPPDHSESKTAWWKKAPGQRFVLVVGDDGAILILLQGSRVIRRLFAPSAEPEHTESFIELISSHVTTPITMLVDMIDQSYVRHTLPPVSPLSVNKLVQRRLDRDFAPEDIKGAISLGREKDGRKEWNYLLISLANNVTLQQWLDLVLELPNPFKGLYLVPVEAQAFMADISRKFNGDHPAFEVSWQVLVSHDKVGGFRQVVLRDGQLIFTRLTQSGMDTSAEVVAGNVEQEVLNTIEYLRRLGYNDQAGLEVVILVAKDIKDAVDRHKMQATMVHVLTPFDAAQGLGMEQAALSGDRYGDVVLGAHFGGRSRHSLRLMSSYAAQLNIFNQGMIGVKVVGALLACLLSYMVLSSIWERGDIGQQLTDLEKNKLQAQEFLTQIQERVKKLDADQAEVLNVAALYRATSRPLESPIDFIKVLVDAKGDGVLIRQVDWQAIEGAPIPQESEIQLWAEFSHVDDGEQSLVNAVREFKSRLEQAYPDFDVSHQKIAGVIGEEDSLVMDFNAQSEQRKPSGRRQDNSVMFTLNGPKGAQE